MPNRYDPELDAEIVFQIFWAIIRAIVGFAIFFVGDLTVMDMLEQPLAPFLVRQRLHQLADQSLKVTPFVGAILCAGLVTKTLRNRVVAILLGTFLGLIAGRILAERLTRNGPELPTEFPLVITLLGGLFGGWVGHRLYRRSQAEPNVLVIEPDPEDSPLWDRELDG